jgi:hypothetical protein
VDNARIAQSGVFNGGAVRVRDHGAVTALGDAQSVYGSAGYFCESNVKFLAGPIGRNLDFLGELADWLACILVSYFCTASELGELALWTICGGCIPRGSTVSVILAGAIVIETAGVHCREEWLG